jgi:hypothetical protein
MCTLPVGESTSKVAAGDHLLLVPIRVRPVLFHQFVAQSHRPGSVAVVAEELHPDILGHYPSRQQPDTAAESETVPQR